MRKLRNYLFVPLLAGILVLTAAMSGTAAYAKPHRTPGHDLVLLQNVPQAQDGFEDGTLQLTPLHVYKDGHFVKPSARMQWTSTNRRVASVNRDGVVKMTGKPGASTILVREGRLTDRILVIAKPVRNSDKRHGNFSMSYEVKKMHGKRYNLVPNAIRGMSLEEKVGQMLMPDFRTMNGKHITELTPEIEALVKKYHLGGVILFRENVVTTEQTARLVADYQKASEKYGLLMSIDQEGGIVTRLQSGTDMPGNMALGAARSEELAHQVGQAIGEELHALGINMNFAPSFDINNNPDNPVIGVRSFSEDPELTAKLGVAYTNGLQGTGTSGTAKHFPGHGDTAVDSHLGLPEVPYYKERLKQVELYPFQQAMDAGVDAIMTAHVTFPKIDDTTVISKKDGTPITVPATLSHKVLTELMRDEMGYDGLITTDALNMNAIAEHFGPVDAVIRAVQAGTDLVLMPVGLESVADGLLDAVQSGKISEQRIEQSMERILSLKLKRGIVKEEAPAPIESVIANAEKTVGSDEHKQVERDVAEKSVTLVKNDNVLPLNAAAEDKIAVVGSSYIDELFTAVKKRHANTVLIKKGEPLTDEELAQLDGVSAIIVGTTTSTVAGRSPSHPQMQMVNELIGKTDVPVIAIGVRNPYDIMAYPEVDVYLAQYSFRTASFEASASAIFGEIAPQGKLPVTIPDPSGGTLYPFGHGLTYTN
ncbi:glycoside hydrolase family 3 protein [Sporosarcina trichiuri]|uniref:glycoside hydrolase family 3 protein n=1 Tax=Sporosarcina trichiuri TaxID=3056445 RepID=UPI0025B3A8C7|nr:glycoside hydrolase family 3 protein [Sporosarcina sp. 0.2-SM1T-5]WJY27551.1 glycoside hydrolase family 3 N-terminal domain-containing protein [Sporosarcina sp. 0.2-SM1T-5]